MGSLPKWIFRNRVVLLIFLTALALRAIFLSPWLEDWDSVQFALALHDFDITKHQPHPPGYPLYIMLAKLLNLLFQNDGLTLSLLSVLLGSFVVIPLYLLAHKMFGNPTALLASLLFIALPVTWVLSVTPVSNIPGLFFVAVLAYLVYVFYNEARKAPLLGFFAGITLGVRFTDFPVVAGFLVLLTFKNFTLRYITSLVIFFLIGVSCWLIPVVILTGTQDFVQAHIKTAQYVIQHDVLGGQFFSITNLVISRLENLSILLETSYTRFLLLVVFLSVIWLLLQRTNWSDFRYQFLLVWFLPYGVLLFTFYNLELAQYTLPLAPSITILVASTVSRLVSRNKSLYMTILILLLLTLFTRSLPQASLKARIPPTILPVLYVKEILSPLETTLITTFTYRQFQYYAPEFINYYGANNTPTNITTSYVVTDYERLKDEIPALRGYKLKDSKKITDRQRRFSRLNETNIYILKRE